MLKLGKHYDRFLNYEVFRKFIRFFLKNWPKCKGPNKNAERYQIWLSNFDKIKNHPLLWYILHDFWLIFSEKLKLLFVFCVSGSDIKWIHQILMFFDTVLDNEFERENRHQNRSDFLGIRNFGPKITVLVKCRSQYQGSYQ